MTDYRRSVLGKYRPATCSDSIIGFLKRNYPDPCSRRMMFAALFNFSPTMIDQTLQELLKKKSIIRARFGYYTLPEKID